MTLSRPFNLIYRPTLTGFGYSRYLGELASQNRTSIRSYKIIEKDLISLLDYIEPSDINKTTYSHRIYELLLRACTEFENNAKAVLKSNNYKRSNLNMLDYYKLNNAMKLSAYDVKIAIWENEPRIIIPFSEWNTDHSLSWYRDYNKVKHNRSAHFKLANLDNLFLATAAVQVILFAQFHMNLFYEFQNAMTANSSDDDFIWGKDSLFALKCKHEWSEEERYIDDIALKELVDIDFIDYSFS